MVKNTMRKTGIFLTIAAFAVSLAACTGKPAQESSVPAETSPAETGVAETSAAAGTDGTESESTASAGEQQPEREQALKLPDYTFTVENFPRMDGSTATVPLAKAVAAALLKTEPEAVGDLTVFNRTTQSFRNLLAGEKDILIVGEPNASVFDEMKEAGFEYEMEEIATDALIFVVNENNPVDSLTTDQIRDIYTGKITNWKEVGGNDEKIIPFQRNEGAGSQALMVKLIMKDTPLMDAPKEYIPTSMGDLMTAVKSYDNSANAIGYSVYYYANDMKMAKGLKIIAVDGVDPEPATIRARKYPHLNAYYCVIPAKTDNEGARVIYDWLATEDGQRLIAKEGYVSVQDVGDGTAGNTGSGVLPEAKYKRLDDAPEGTLTSLQPRDDYGLLIPYDGSALYESYEDENGESTGYISGYLQGFFDEQGRLVTDPVYNEIEQIQYYDSSSGEEILLPFYRIAKYDSDAVIGENEWDLPSEAVHQQFVSLDGSVVSEEYSYISAMQDHLLCKKAYESKDFIITDLEGKEVMSRRKMDQANGGTISEKADPAYGVTDIAYGDGFFLIYLSDGYYYANAETGRLTYGPYDYAVPFRNGKALVRHPDQTAGVIDTTGKELIGSWYDEANILANGNILASDQEGTDLFDGTGSLLKKFRDIGKTFDTKWGFIARPAIDSERNGTICYDCDGNLLFSDEEGVYEVDYHLPIFSIRGDPADADASMASENGSGLWVGNLLTGKSVFLDKMEYVNAFQTMYGYVDVPYFESNYYDPENDRMSNLVLNDELETVLETDQYVIPIRDGVSGGWYFALSGISSDRCTVIDMDLKEIMETDALPSAYGGIFVVNRDHAACAYDRDGKELFCYPMISSLEE